MHEGTGGAPITGTSFGPITRESSREAIKILGGLVRNRCRPLGHAHRAMGVQDPLCNAAPTEISGNGDHIPQGVPKWSYLNQTVQALRNKGAIEPAPLTPGFYSHLFLATKATGEWRPIIDLSSLNVFVHCPSFTTETPQSILGALQQGQWLTSIDLKDTYFHIGINPADRRYLRFCHNGTTWQIHSAAIWVVNQSESTVQITFIFIDFRICDFAFAFKTQNSPCVSRFRRILFSDRFQFVF